MTPKSKVRIPKGARLDPISNPKYLQHLKSSAEVRTSEQDRELVVISENVYQAGVHDAIIDLGNMPEASDCFNRFKKYKAETGKRITSGIDANPDEIKRIKDERKEFATDIEIILRMKFDPFNRGYVIVNNMEEAKELLYPALALVSMARATRNMTFSNKPLIDSLGDQKDCFSKDRSSLNPESGVDNTELIESMNNYISEIFYRFHDASSGGWKPPKLRQKGSSCLERNTVSGGRNEFEMALVEALMAVVCSKTNIGLLRSAFEVGVHLGMNPVELTIGEKVQRALVGTEPTEPFGKHHTFQDVKLVAVLVYGVQEQKITICPYDECEDLIIFDGPKDRYKGARIIELAGKDRTVSVGSAVISVIGEYLSSQFRGMLIHTPEYTEGYLGSEVMEEMLSRMNAGSERGNSPFNLAVNHLLENPELLKHVDPRVPENKRRRNSVSGNFQTGKLTDDELPLRALITDFTAATENISHRFAHLLAKQFRISAMPGEVFSGSRWPTAHAAFIEFIASDFGIDYAGGLGGEYSVESNSGVGLLMGSSYTKEILHFASAWASNSEIDHMNRARLVLGDDLFLLIFSEFLKRAEMAGLQTNFSKTQITFMPTLTDRSIVIVRMGAGNDKTFAVLGSDIHPPKLYSISAKYSEGQTFHCSIPRTGAILRSLVSEDLKQIRFPSLYKEIEDAMKTTGFLRELYEADPGKGIPLAYGGSSWLSDGQEREWMISNCAISIANLFGACDGRYRLNIFHTDREKDWRRVGFVRLDSVTHSITDYCPSFTGLSDRIQADRQIIDSAKGFLGGIYPEEIEKRDYPSSVFYISPEDILKVFKDPYKSDDDLFNYGNYKMVRLENKHFRSYSYLLDSLNVLTTGIATASRVKRPPI